MILQKQQTPNQFYCDAVKRSSDPTGTMDIRRRFSSLFEQRYRSVRQVLQRTVVDQDILGLHPGSTSPVAMAGSTGNREIGFQTWLDTLLKRVVVEDGEWMRPLIALSYNRAIVRAQRLTRSNSLPHDMAETINALTALCYVETQGIAEAVSQRIMRTAIHAWLHNDKPAETFTAMAMGLSTIGVTRSRAMVELMAVKAFTTGTLDQFEAANVKRVGIVAEMRKKAGMDHATVRDAGKSGGAGGKGTYEKNFGLQGPGSRISRKGEGPSRSTISRIRAAAAALEEAGNVNVQTAGDDLVCQQCEDIEGDNPYSIDAARSLIPAHPFCRCAFVPVDEDKGYDWGNEDTRKVWDDFMTRVRARRAVKAGWFSADSHLALDEFNENEPRDPDGKWTTGEGGGASKPQEKKRSAAAAARQASVKFGGTGQNREALEKAVQGMPSNHFDLIKNVEFINADMLSAVGAAGRAVSPVGRYVKGPGKPVIMVGDRVHTPDGPRASPDPLGSLFHEIGHAIDDKINGSAFMGHELQASTRLMTPAERDRGKYWINGGAKGGSRELFAEVYKLTFGGGNPSHCVGMPADRARQVFAPAMATLIERMRHA